MQWRKTARRYADRFTENLLEALLVGNRQFLAALRPTASQHSAAVFVGHARTEAVLVRSFSP